MALARHWCFTINNYDEAIVDSLRISLSSEKVRYAIFGKEVGEGGTPHLQGYVSFTGPKRLGGVKKVVGLKAHVEICKGSEEQNIAYCSKDDPNPEEFGNKKQSGKRTDLEEFKTAVKEGIRDKKKLREEYSEVYAKYRRFCDDYISDNTPLPEIPCHPLNAWQQWLDGCLKLPPDDRKILFVVDKEGNKGKSWYSHYYCRLHENSFVLRPTKHADMAYAIPDDLRVLFLDCTRTQVEYLPYTFLEELKDGYVFSSKYESRMKYFSNMHVVVMLNEDPDMTKLSSDRYEIYNL